MSGSDVDLTHAAPCPVPDLDLRRFADQDAAELLVLQRCCWVQEALANDTLDIPPLHETLQDVRAWGHSWLTLVGRLERRMVASVRARRVEQEWQVGRIMVVPDLEGRGLGSWLLATAEGLAPPDVETFTLFTGVRSVRNLRTYARAGYTVDEQTASSPSLVPGTVSLRKAVTPPPGR